MLHFRHDDWHHCESKGLPLDYCQNMYVFLCHFLFFPSCEQYASRAKSKKQSVPCLVFTETISFTHTHSEICLISISTVHLKYKLSLVLCSFLDQPASWLKNIYLFSVNQTSALLSFSFPLGRLYQTCAAVLPLQILTGWLHWKRKQMSCCLTASSHLLVRQVSSAAESWQHVINMSPYLQ